jgi:hypothetical protein
MLIVITIWFLVIFAVICGIRSETDDKLILYGFVFFECSCLIVIVAVLSFCSEVSWGKLCGIIIITHLCAAGLWELTFN